MMLGEIKNFVNRQLNNPEKTKISLMGDRKIANFVNHEFEFQIVNQNITKFVDHVRKNRKFRRSGCRENQISSVRNEKLRISSIRDLKIASFVDRVLKSREFCLSGADKSQIYISLPTELNIYGYGNLREVKRAPSETIFFILSRHMT